MSFAMNWVLNNYMWSLWISIQPSSWLHPVQSIERSSCSHGSFYQSVCFTKHPPQGKLKQLGNCSDSLPHDAATLHSFQHRMVRSDCYHFRCEVISVNPLSNQTSPHKHTHGTSWPRQKADIVCIVYIKIYLKEKRVCLISNSNQLYCKCKI